MATSLPGFLLGAFLLLPAAARAACVGPAGNTRDVIYNDAYNLYQFCDGTNWWAMKSGGVPGTSLPGNAAGAAGQVQFNNAGVFGASANMFWDNAALRLGIGTTAPSFQLQTTGDVRVGSSAAACTVTNEGALRYNSASKTLQYCNGSAWIHGFGDGNALKSVQVFTAGGTWTRPSGITSIELIVVGGGGGGGGSTADTLPGLGGGGGGTCWSRVDVSGLASQAVAVGGGGAGGSTAGGAGAAGGTSTFGTRTASGGGGGAGDNGWPPGSGGIGSGCNVNIRGDSGLVRDGGSTTHGGGGRYISSTGQAGGAYGGGGSAGKGVGVTGGPGAGGVLIVWEYGP